MKSKTVSLFLAALLAAAPAHAQRREPERERFRTPHWVFDDRFHHNHYYPAPGYSVTVLPAGHLAITFRGGRYFYHSGVWFQAAGPGFVVARPPIGIVAPVLPPAYTTVMIAGVPYYYANDVYYAATPGGYLVTEPPPAAPASAPAIQPAPAQLAPPGGAPSGNWYYCDSSKAFYPYVSECKEGWRSVPATPPPAR